MSRSPDYLRACGEDRHQTRSDLDPTGIPPPAWRRQTCPRTQPSGSRSTSTHVEKTLHGAPRRIAKPGYLHPRGENPLGTNA